MAYKPEMTPRHVQMDSCPRCREMMLKNPQKREPRTLEQEMDYQRFSLKGDIELGRAKILEILPDIITTVTELKNRLDTFSRPGTPCNDDQLYQKFQIYIDDLRKANQKWFESSRKMEILEALAAAKKRDEEKNHATG